MRKLMALMIGAVAIWQISLTSSTQRWLTGGTQGDQARQVLYVMTICGTLGQLVKSNNA